MLGIAASGCGDEAARPPLTVFAAASLTEALEACVPSGARLSFAGSDALAGQIRQGVTPDVLVAASTSLPERLAAEGELERPVAFATNALVVAVPADARLDGVEALAGDGVGIAIGAEGVPVGDYTRSLLARLPRATRRAIVANVRTEEPDVKGVVGKLTQGAVDAGFVYASDVRATNGRLRAVRLPDALQPDVAYGAGVVRGAQHPGEAAAFVSSLQRGACADALRARGFGRAPGV